jgi:hypothetical protein
MNTKFQQLSLMAGGSHYPTINPDLQQRFGQSIVLHIVGQIEAETVRALEQNQTHVATTLQALALQILQSFDMPYHTHSSTKHHETL